MHGGDWNNGPGELHSWWFLPAPGPGRPRHQLGTGWIPYQCDLLQIAFESAWVQT